MAGVAFTQLQANNVTTTFVGVIDIRWQPMVAADIRIGYFVDENSYNAGYLPVCTQYVSLDITQINPQGNIPQQIFNQLTAAGAILAGGTLIM